MALTSDDVVAATRDQRLGRGAYLETLASEQWDASSLCAGCRCARFGDRWQPGLDI